MFFPYSFVPKTSFFNAKSNSLHYKHLYPYAYSRLARKLITITDYELLE